MTNSSSSRNLRPEHIAAINALIEKGMRAFKVPGVAVAIVNEAGTVFQRGFGERNLEKAKPVTEDTLFMLASVSKSFTVSAMHASAHAGQFKWDKPVRDYVPEFALADDRATREMTVRDLVTHRSGLPRHDHVWLERDVSAIDLITALKHLQPNSSFRSEFCYQNLMYMTAGHLLARVSGMPWERALKKSLFQPLGMRRATSSIEVMSRDPDHASGYELVGSRAQLASAMSLGAMNPTGGIIASVSELARFVSMHIARGVWRSTIVLPETAIASMQTPETVMNEAIEWPEIGATQYGMGWFLTHYRGRQLVHHGGNLRGFSTLVSFLPREKIGVVFLSNVGASPLRSPLSYSIYDLLLDVSPIDWIGRYQGYVERVARSAKKAKEAFSLRDDSAVAPKSASLHAFVGDYEHPAYGIVCIKQQGKRLSMHRQKNSAPLKHLHHDVFITPSDKQSRLSRTAVSFHRGFDGEVSGLSIPFEPSVKAIEFVRIAALKLRAKKTLLRYVGCYAIGQSGASVNFDPNGRALTLEIAPLQRYSLVPTVANRFRAQESDFVFVQFATDASGRAITMCLIDSTGEYAGDRI